MAKKKVVSKSKAETQATKKSKKATPKTTQVQNEVPDRNCSSDDIGYVAGEIWHRLDSGGNQSISQLKKSISAPSDVVMAAVGWLAREDKVEFQKSGRSTKISLR